MPRKSSEAISAALWREPAVVSPPPDYLKGVAREIYLEVSSAYPAERFPPGATCILEIFAVASAAMREITKRLQTLPVNAPEYGKLTGQLVKLSQAQLSAATKLRLCPSSSWRADDGRLSERAPARNRRLLGLSS